MNGVDWTLRVWRLGAVACAVLASSGGVAADSQGAPRAAPAVEPIASPPTVTEIIDRVCACYRGTSVRERVSIAVRTPGGGTRSDGSATPGSTRSSTVLVQLDPASPGTQSTDARNSELWIQAGRLRLHWSASTMTVCSDRLPSPWCRVQTEKHTARAALNHFFPPMPVPQLDFLAATNAAELQDLTPFARGIRWREARVDLRAGTHEAIGDCVGGTVRVLADAKSSRLREVRIELIEPNAMTIEMVVRPAPTRAIVGHAGGREGLFTLPSDPSLRVGSIGELLERLAEASVAPGFECDRLMGLGGEPMTLEELSGKARTHGPGPASATTASLHATTVLVFLPVASEVSGSAALAAVTRAVAVVGGHFAVTPSGAAGDCARLVCVVGRGQDREGTNATETASVPSERMLERMQEVIDAVREGLGQSACPTLWAWEGAWTSGYLPSGVLASAVVLNAGARVHAVIPLIAGDDHAEQFESELAAAMTEREGSGPSESTPSPAPVQPKP